MSHSVPMELWREMNGQEVPENPSGDATAVSILAIATGLLAIGAVMSFSASAAPDRPLIGANFWRSPNARQFIFVIGGLVAMLVMSRIPYYAWALRRGLPAMILLGVSLAATLLVLVPHIGVEAKGAARWVQLGPPAWGIRFQPSELVKLALPLFLSSWMVCRADIRKFWKGFVPAAVVLGLSVGAVGLEDFGTAALLAAVGGAMLVYGGARWLHLFACLVPGVAAFGVMLISKPHRIARLSSFMDIWADSEGKGYQAIQSLCTIASGGWWGRGLGQGYVKGYLPEARSDFIFAVICEELGVVGAVAVIALLIALLWQGRTVMRQCREPVGRLLAFAMVFTLGLQAVMNIAVVTVSVPTKGISLPLVSAGGSGVIFLGALVGVLANIARQRRVE